MVIQCISGSTVPLFIFIWSVSPYAAKVCSNTMHQKYLDKKNANFFYFFKHLEKYETETFIIPKKNMHNNLCGFKRPRAKLDKLLLVTLFVTWGSKRLTSNLNLKKNLVV